MRLLPILALAHRDPDRRRGIYLHLCEGILLPDQRSRRVRELPRDGESLSRLDEELAPCRRGVQRLPHPAGPDPEVHHESHQRLQSFARVHDRAGSRSRCASPRATKRSRNRPAGSVTRPSWTPSKDHSRRTNGCPASAAIRRSDTWSERRRRSWLTQSTSQTTLVRRARADARRGGRRRRDAGRRGAARQHLRAQAGGAEPVLPCRGAHRRH